MKIYAHKLKPGVLVWAYGTTCWLLVSKCEECEGIFRLTWLDIEGNLFFLSHLNNYIDNFPIHELMMEDIPEEYEYLFDQCSTEELTQVRDDLLVCMN